MKKMLFAILLGLTVVTGVMNLATPVIYGQEAPPEEPKPEKPGGE